MFTEKVADFGHFNANPESTESEETQFQRIFHPGTISIFFSFKTLDISLLLDYNSHMTWEAAPVVFLTPPEAVCVCEGYLQSFRHFDSFLI